MDRLRKWRVPGVLAGLMLLLQWIGPQALRYDAGLIAQGQLWRGFTAHLVHANATHLALNLAGLALCVGITGVNWSAWQWLWRIMLLATGISAGFYWLHQNMGWYVGFSGVLFGLYLLAACDTYRQQAVMSGLLSVFIVAKIAMEQLSSVNMTSSELIGVPVMVDAHLYGVSLAVLIICAQLIARAFLLKT